MATIFQLASGDKCLVLEPQESCWFGLYPPTSWSGLKLALITSLTTTGSLNSFPESVTIDGKSYIGLSNTVENQTIFGFTNNATEIPRSSNYTGMFLGIINPSGSHSYFGASTSDGSSSSSILGNFAYTSAPNNDAAVPFLSFRTINLSESGASVNGYSDSNNSCNGVYVTAKPRSAAASFPSGIYSKAIQTFALEKSGSSHFVLKHRGNYFTSMTGNNYASNSCSRENFLQFLRSDSFYTATNQIYFVPQPSNYTGFSGVFDTSSGLNGGSRVDPNYFLIHFPNPSGRLRIHGIFTEFY